MRSIIYLLFLVFPISVYGQSKSVSSFRSDFKENTNMFFYSSTLKMLNTENNAEFADLIEGIEEIRVLNYDKAKQKFSGKDVAALKSDLTKESYNMMIMLNEKGNSVFVYGKEKKGRTAGVVAIVENTASLVLIDLIGTIDVKKFMELKNKLDSRNQ